MSKINGKKPKLRDKILLIIARHGAQSKTSLMLSLQKHYSVISNIVDALEDEGLVIYVGQETPSEKRRGIFRSLFHLTNKGVGKVSKLELSVEDFWKLLENKYNNYPNSDLIPIDELISDFEKQNIPISLTHIPLLWKNFYIEHDTWEKNTNIQKILLMLVNGSLSELQVLQKIKSKCDNNITKKEVEQFHQNIQKALENFWITFENKNQLRLSHLGVLLVFSQLRGIFRMPDDKISSDQLSIIQSLKINYNELFPQIFNHWNTFASILDHRALVDTMIYFVERNTEFMESEFQDENGLFASLDKMSNSLVEFSNRQTTACVKLLENILIIPYEKKTLEKIHRWILEGKVTKIPPIRKEVLPMFDIILKCIETIEKYSFFLSYENAKSKLNKIGLEPNFIKRRQTAEPILQNVITFQFFSIFIQNINDNQYWKWRNYHQQDKIQLKNLRLFNSSDSKSSWKEVLKKDPTLSVWYEQWIKAITNFETKNLEEIKKMKLEI